MGDKKPDREEDQGGYHVRLFHGVDIGEPPRNAAEAEAQRDQMSDYLPPSNDSSGSDK